MSPLLQASNKSLIGSEGEILRGLADLDISSSLKSSNLMNYYQNEDILLFKLDFAVAISTMTCKKLGHSNFIFVQNSLFQPDNSIKNFSCTSGWSHWHSYEKDSSVMNLQR